MIQQVPQQSSDLGDMPTPTRGDDGNVLTYDRQARAYVLKPPPKAERRGGMLSYIAGNPGPTRLRDLDDVSGTPSGATDGYAYLYDSALDAFVLGEVSTSSTIAGATDFGGTPGPGTDGYAVTWDNDAGEFTLTEMASGGTPGGSTTQVQYNSSGSFAGHSGFTYDGSGTATLSTALVAPVIRPASDSETAIRFQNAAGSADVLTIDTTNSHVYANKGTDSTNFFLGSSGNSTAASINATAIGNLAADAITSANSFVAIGYQAGSAVTSANNWTAIGYHSGRLMTTDSNWTAIGYRAAFSSTGGVNWTAIGSQSAYNATTATTYIALGMQAGYTNSTGSSWFAVGYRAGYLSTGDRWAGLGYEAGRNNASGDNWVYLGYQTGYNATGSNGVFIGYQAGYSEASDDRLHIANTSSKSLLLGDFANNRLAIGGASLEVPTATLDVIGDTIRLRTSKTPSSASDTGNAGDIAWDSSYIYVCTAADTWKRTAIATW